MATLMQGAGVLVFAVCLCSVPAPAQDKPNFYIPQTTESKSKLPPQKTATPAAKPTATPPPKKAAETPKPAAKAKATPTPAPARAAPAASTVELRKQDQAPARSFKPPLDGFGLAAAFKHRWDFSYFLISTSEELAFRLDAARRRTLRIARAFSSLSSEVEIRQRNLNAAALAAYLLSRDQATWTPVGGRNLTEAQMLAVRVTMRQDMRAMDQSLTDYETLRNALNESAEHVAALEKSGLSASPPNAMADLDLPMLPLAEVARAQTRAVLDEHNLSAETLRAIMASEILSIEGDERQSITSFAPPPPMSAGLDPSIQTSSNLPVSPAPGAVIPRNVSLTKPEQTALLVPTGVNAPVHAVRKGVVAYAGPFRGYGGMVIIEHEKGVFSVYSHLESIQVRDRETIAQGAILGRAGVPPEIGQSGIHFQVRRGKDNLDPSQWLGGTDVAAALSRGQ